MAGRKVEEDRLELPADLVNGFVSTFLKNVRADAVPESVSYVAATPKPRLVRLAISVAGTEPFKTGATARKATHYVLKVKIGGITGWLAPLDRQAAAGCARVDSRRRGTGIPARRPTVVCRRPGLAHRARESHVAPGKSRPGKTCGRSSPWPRWP